MHVVIFSGGSVENGFFVQDALERADLIIAADSGAQSAMQFGFIPNIVVGDFDSLLKKFHEDLIKQEVECITANPKKDETDTQLAVDIALQKGAREIAILGGVVGNRLDHVLGNVFLSSYVGKAKIFFINGNQKIWIEEGPAKVRILGKKGDLLSLIPLSEIEKIETENLAYPLKNETLYFGIPRGMSNVLVQDTCLVRFKKGKLLIAQTHKQ